ncbi:MAG: pyridoxine 5'-phosphate synthase [Pyrinomonadaceae bacterium]|nr:pyridoxine 5'-phosphate synthase [Pyrinomonadaceae bacterium]MCX7638909.1 pyridoxine 5'-phosphate synthase [Pyrinomonadaceae bacterium]MDW8304954.1 pyridoxine 5'-phosphate synthase [Acidobacteriota bacterium]
MKTRLNVNIDHVATVRQARRTIEPSIVAAAVACEKAGADGITVHLRQDRRHIQDRDVRLLREILTTYLNVEMAVHPEMISIALEVKPDAVTLVPEKPQEITTEGGLNIAENFDEVQKTVARLRDAGIFTSIFVDPDTKQIELAKRAGANQVELCTAQYSEFTLPGKSVHGEGLMKARSELRRLAEAARHATNLGLIVAAGHGLTYRNVGAIASIKEISELNIGHNIIARSIFVGLERAVKEMLEAIRRGKQEGAI